MVERGGLPIGIVPFRTTSALLKFEIGNRRLGRLSFPGIRLLGGTLLLPQSHVLFEKLFHALHDRCPSMPL
jgi:hypothetical protein